MKKQISEWGGEEERAKIKLYNLTLANVQLWHRRMRMLKNESAAHTRTGRKLLYLIRNFFFVCLNEWNAER